MADLQRMVLLAKGAQGAACKEVIRQALDSPKIHVFGELLELPSVQALGQSTAHKPWFDLLQLFSFGSYPAYKSTSGLPELSEQMLLKLRLITIVSIGSRCKVIPYSQLMEALDVSSLRVLEDIIIEAIYRGLVGGKLNQKDELLSLDYVMGRDLRPGDLDAMIELLDSWCQNCNNLLNDMQSKMASADQQKASDLAVEAKLKDEIESIKKALKTADKGGGGRSSDALSKSDFGDEMHGRSNRAAKRHMARHNGPESNYAGRS